ncbi:unnamed protein product [Linum tenue]|uniref:Response regulatory domain-containing protein n=1 Tax=Linum tenue TaxID=586396 RepID=A0AAV0I1Y5_9ROSI|nr:unnamed protein product [Linum tenue]
MEFAVIATVLVALFVAYLAFLFIQFVYVVIRRKALVHRRTSPDDLPISLPLPAAKSPGTAAAAAAGSISPTQIKHFLRSAWKNKTSSSLSSKALKAAEAAAAPPSPPSAVVVQAAPPPTDEEVEEMLMGSRMRGPPRFLFTIKEEEREGSAADSASFEDSCGGGSSSVRINKEFTGHAPYYGDHCNSDKEVSSPVIGVVVELNQLTAPFGTAPCSRLHAAEEADGGSGGGGGVVLPRILLAPDSAVGWEKLSPMALRVLLVEADDSTRKITSALLGKCGYRVSAVTNGLKAWEVLKGKPDEIDLILTEVDLPSVLGYALLSLIMDHEICKNIPVMEKKETQARSLYVVLQ